MKIIHCLLSTFCFNQLHLIHDYPDQKRNLISSINTLDAEEINYFGGDQKVKLLLKYLLS
jgi:hypothetical protein